MPKLSAIATALALLIHSLLGCCCHHAHAQSAGDDAAAPHSCPCHDHPQPAPFPHDSAPGEPCDEGNCTLLASDNLAATSLAIQLTPHPASTLAAPSPLLPGRGQAAGFPTPSPPSPTPVELHQILRI